MAQYTLTELVRCSPSPDVAARWTDYVACHLHSFRVALRDLPLPAGVGSISTAEAFWLFRVLSELRPSTVVDSGSATGWSAFIAAAAAPQAHIYCFDPYREPTALPPNATYRDTDWTVQRRFPSDTVALFDDHVNQRRRVVQARRAGLRHVLFHDVYRDLTKSTVSLMFTDLIGLVERIHIFDPLWNIDPIFTDTSSNSQMYRWLTWLWLTPCHFRPAEVALRALQRHGLRNPGATELARENWRAR